jgi:hypothetical protein
MSQVLHGLVIVFDTTTVMVNIHKLLFAFEALGQVKFG